ncbi:MAG: glycosyltransferase [Actinomycetia bacterium]|nr:glycosyltransferase [Actinomycetes bacterium]
MSLNDGTLRGGAPNANDLPHILLISDDRAWPMTSGYRRRIAQQVRALAQVGTVYWIVAPRGRRDDGETPTVPAELSGRVVAVLVPAPTRSRASRVTRWTTGDLPRSVAAGDWGSVLAHLSRLDLAAFDFVFCVGLASFEHVKGTIRCDQFTVVDMVDLESTKLEQASDIRTQGIVGRVRSGLNRSEVRRWRRLEKSVAAEATATILSSDSETDTIGGNARCVPNTYDDPAPIRRRISSPPNILFVGSLDYPPNADGLDWFVCGIWPTLRARIPELSMRVVGEGLSTQHSARRCAGIEVIGPVADLRPLLEEATLCVVPLRWAGGTRVKILEAFAHELPVVSTTVGAAGLDVSDDCELRVADDPEGFASACAEIIEDPHLAERIAEAGRQAFESKHETNHVVLQSAEWLSLLVDQARET